MTDNKTSFYSDVQLARAAQKDRQQMEQLVSRLHPKVSQVVWALVGNVDQAQEIEQTAILEILKCLGNYRGEGSLESWAKEVAYRTGLKVLRRNWRWHKHHFTTSEPPELPDSEPSHNTVKGPEKTYATNRLRDFFHTKIDVLSEEQRTAFNLHLIYGYTVKETSQLMSTSINTTKYRIKTAVREIRGIILENPILLQMMEDTKKEQEIRSVYNICPEDQ